MLGGAVFFGIDTWESRSSAAWPHVSGVITSTSAEKTCGSGRGSNRWEAKIAYQYTVNGANYRGHRSTNMRLYCDTRREDVVAWVSGRYPVGKAVDVYYNPSDPEASFLRPGVVSTFEMVMVFACLVVSALMALGGWLSLRRVKVSVRVRRRVRIL